MEAGVPKEWVPVIQKCGYLNLEAMKEVKPGKLHQEICGLNKKMKLGLENPSQGEVKKLVRINLLIHKEHPPL